MEFTLSIKNLFNMFDYEIGYEGSLRFLIGLNGSGKTTIFKILSAISEGDEGFFNELPFGSIQYRDKETSILVKKGKPFDKLPFPVHFIDEWGIPIWMDVPSLNGLLNLYSEKLKRMDKDNPGMELFFNFMRKWIRDKELHLDEGILFTDFDGDKLPLSYLSDGQKRLLVYLFTILFETEENSLVLIDTPESHLHIELQREFIKILKEIQNIHPVEFLIATHSPQIVGKDWNSTVSLSDLNEKRNQNA